MTKKGGVKEGLQEDGTYITTQKDFEAYKKETEYWIKKFGITDLEFIIRRDATNSESRAECWVNTDGAIVQSVLQEEWDAPPRQDNEVEKCAFHEVMEILLGDLWVLGERRFVTADQMETARHKIIRRFENCVWKEDFDGRNRKK